MTPIIIFIAIAAVAGGFFVWGFIRADNRQSAAVPSMIGVLLAVMALAATGLTQIDAGHVGVVRQFGAVLEDELGPGMHYVVPLVYSVEVLDTRVQAIEFENLDAASSEYQPVALSGKINVSIVPTEANRLVQNVGADWAEKIVLPAYTNIVKEIIPQYSITEILPNRDVIRRQTIERLRANIESRYGITVNDVYLSNIGFSEAYTEAIVAKQVAEQETLRQQQLIEKSKAEAQQVVEKAKGDAQSAIERARGEAEANRLISQSLTPQVLQSRYIDKLADDIKVMMVPSGNFIFDLKSLMEQEQVAP